jgi:hypothetical protein
MDNAIIRKKLVESASKLDHQLDWYQRNKDKDYCDNYVNKEL